LAKWLFYDLKKSSEILKSTAFSEELTKLFKYLMEIDLSHEWQTVTSTIFILKYFQHVCALAKWLFYDLKKSSEILKSTAFSEELTKLFKYLMEIDLSHEWQTVTSTIFSF
jgi:hypothetical protein